jgi:hypothetical protein
VPLTGISSPRRGSGRSLDDPNLQATPSSAARDIHGQLKPGPYAELVESTSQVIFDYWLWRANDFANFTVGQPLPDQVSDLEFLRSE